MEIPPSSLAYSVRLSNLSANRLSDLFRPGTPTEISRQNPLPADSLYTLHKLIRRLFLPKPSHHLRCGPESANGIRNAFPSDVEGRAMDRLEHAWVLPCRVEVGCRRDTNGACECGGEVGEDIGVLGRVLVRAYSGWQRCTTYKVRSYDRV